MPNHICVICGQQYAESTEPPRSCPICEDERQYVNPRGQSWVTLERLVLGHRNELKPLEPGLTAITTVPKFAIGQRALLVQSSKGNVLWDCPSLIDDATIESVGALGGISSLAMSHPHLFGSMVDWSHAFGRVPIHIHAAHREWVQRPDPVIEFWDGDSRELEEGVALYRCAGPAPRLIHVQLSESHSAYPRGSAEDCRHRDAAEIRPHLRPFLRFGDRSRRQRRSSPFGGAVQDGERLIRANG